MNVRSLGDSITLTREIRDALGFPDPVDTPEGVTLEHTGTELRVTRGGPTPVATRTDHRRDDRRIQHYTGQITTDAAPEGTWPAHLDGTTLVIDTTPTA